MKKILSILILVLILIGCKKVPLTDRNQFNVIPNSQLNSSSFTSYDQVLKESKLSNNSGQVKMVQDVGNRIKKAVEQYLKENNIGDATEGFKWEFNLIAENVVNAWCMPGGKVAFYEGILPVCKDEAGIAVVMGHEVAHAIAKHGGERMSQALVQQLGGVALSVALQQQPEQTQALAMAAYTGGSTVLGVLPFSRLHESEADELGIKFMALAGYDPAEAPKFWQRMKAQSGGAPPEFLSTHPSNNTRIEDLNKLLPEAQKYYAKSSKAKNNPIPNLGSISSTNLQEKNSGEKTKIKMKIGN
ncbi:peptidase M48 [Marivirga tractuosa]|uniref:Peptidase M48 Ste24p n=1 Tax=Marivirga tractuosa (strain ATCC 23168 / DSM 4126 / NBRC 15989 / NCIMB 1408 / VKM B-1430 / H-43) TaxID=643867 RepID=E4TU48_MARTH|nr:M48 family metallopeptidase [Marivirga tractuosa]ADR20976.1 peptidase M48 Ste24p [Marivirga tractuosa DSM 4126]BDD14571.1 peptidase M48 [Marivirga tractuosa]